MTQTWDNAVYLTVDIALFAPIDGVRHVLLIQRDTDNDAYPGYWALPGGYVDKGERIEPAAHRELSEETHVIVPAGHLHMVGYYDQPDRDPRDRVVSIAFTSMLAAPTLAVAGGDAKDARWVPVAEALASADIAFDHHQIIADSATCLDSITQANVDAANLKSLLNAHHARYWYPGQTT